MPMGFKRKGYHLLGLRAIAIVLIQLLCLPPPDLLAQSSPKSVFATKQASHETVRQRNLRELDAKQGMLGRKDKEQGQGTTPAVKPQGPLSLAALQDLSAISVPPEDGQILEVWSPSHRGGQPSSPTVILLQDLHTQAEAQQAEGRILQHLHKTYNLKLVAAEGAEGPFAIEFFKRFPEDTQLRADVAKTFLAAGELTGHEYAIITEQLPIAVVGVEDMTLHAENTEAYRQVLDVAPAAQAAIARVQQALAALEPKLYPAPLQALRAHVEQFQGGALAMPEYVGYVSKLAQHHGVSMETVAPNLVRFKQLQTMESSINRDQVQAELRQLLSALSAQLQGGGSQPLAQELEILTGQLQRQAIAPAYCYPRLMALAREAQLDLTGYASVVAFAAYLGLTQQLQHHRLLPELESLEWALSERLAGSNDAKTLAMLVHHAQLLHDLFSLKLTPDQVLYVQQHRDEFVLPTFKTFLDEQLPRHSIELFVDYPQQLVDAHLPLVERFYELAHRRDQTLVTNTLALVQGREALPVKREREAVGMSSVTVGRQARPTTDDERRTTNNGRAEAVLLVAGGFHTPGVTALLRERQIPYVVVTPTAAGELDEALYHRLIRGQRSTLDELLRIGQQQGFVTPSLKPGLLQSDVSNGTATRNALPTALGMFFLAFLYVSLRAATGAELASPELLAQAQSLLDQTLALATEVGVSPEHLEHLSASVQQAFEQLQHAMTQVQEQGGNAHQVLQPAIDHLQTALNQFQQTGVESQLGTKLAELGSSSAMVLNTKMNRRRFLTTVGGVFGLGVAATILAKLGLTWLLPDGEERRASATTVGEQHTQEQAWFAKAFEGSSIPATEPHEARDHTARYHYQRLIDELYGEEGRNAPQVLQTLSHVRVYGGQEIAQLQRSAAAPVLEFGTMGYSGYAADFAANARDHLALRVAMVEHYLDFALAPPGLSRGYAVGVLRSLAGEFVTLGQGAYDAAQRLDVGITLPEILKTLTRANAIDRYLEAVETLLTSWKSRESEVGIVQEIEQGIADVQQMRATWKEFLQQRSQRLAEQRPDQTQPAGIEEDVSLTAEQLAFTTWFDPQTGVVWSESRGEEVTRDATTLYSTRIVEPGLDWVERRLEVELERGTSRPRGVNDVLTAAGAEGPAAIGLLMVFGNRFLGLLQYVATGKVRFSLFDSGAIERAERSVGNDVRHRNVADAFHGWVYRGTDEELPLQLRDVVGVLEGEQVFTNQQRAAYRAVANTEESGRKVLTYESYPLLGLQQARTIWQAVEQAGLDIKWLEVQMYDPSSSQRIGGQAWMESGAVSGGEILELGPDSFLAAWSDAEPFVNALMGRVSETKRQQIRGIQFNFTRERSALSAPLTRTNDQGQEEQVRVLIIGRDLFSIPLDTKSMEDRLLQPLREKGVLKKGGFIPLLPPKQLKQLLQEPSSQPDQKREPDSIQRTSQTLAAATEQSQTPPSTVSAAATPLTPVQGMGPGFNPLAAGFHQDVRDEGRTAPVVIAEQKADQPAQVSRQRDSATGTHDERWTKVSKAVVLAYSDVLQSPTLNADELKTAVMQATDADPQSARPEAFVVLSENDNTAPNRLALVARGFMPVTAAELRSYQSIAIKLFFGTAGVKEFRSFAFEPNSPILFTVQNLNALTTSMFEELLRERLRLENFDPEKFQVAASRA